MKTLSILLFFVALFSTSVIENSYSQITEKTGSTSETSLTPTTGTLGAINPTVDTNEQKTQSNTEIFIQILLRDSDGHLVGYIEGYPQIFYLDQVINWVEPQAHKSTIIKDGERREMMQYEDKLSWSEAQTMGAYYLNVSIGGTMTTGLYFHHDSFHVQPGDTAQVFWTVIR